MRFKHLNATNLKFALDLHPNSTTVIQALKLYDGNDYENLEELLRVEWQKAQDKAVLLQQMYSEVANHNLLSGLNDTDENYDS